MAAPPQSDIKIHTLWSLADSSRRASFFPEIVFSNLQNESFLQEFRLYISISPPFSEDFFSKLEFSVVFYFISLNFMNLIFFFLHFVF